MARKPKYANDGSWWTADPDAPDKGALHRRLFTHCRALEEDQYDLHCQNLLNAKLYTNRELMGFEWNGSNATSFRPLNANLDNVIQSVVDTLVALIAKNRPKATPVARAADFDVYLRTRQLDRFLWGEFICQNLWVKGEQVFTNGCIYGTGVLKHDIDGKEVYTEVVNPDEILVDQRECLSGMEPIQMHQRKLVSKLWLIETYASRDPDLRDLINKCSGQDFQYTSYRSPGEEQIVVLESWHLPTRKGSSDGRHVICIENATLVDEKYTRDWFPFTFFRWNIPQAGFYGRSLVEDLTGYQIRLNELNEVIRIGQDLMCVPRVFVQQGGGIVRSQFDNSIGKVITVRGEIPQAQTWTAFSPEIYNERDRIKASAFEFAGISQLSAQSKLPTQARLDSSEALREYSAIENERFSRQAQAYEQFFLDVAKRLVQLNAEVHAGRGVDEYGNAEAGRKQFYRSKYLIQQIDWDEVDLDADKYVMQISASSILNMSPAARKDKLNEWVASGTITQQQYQAWSGQPDLEKLSDLMAASNDYVEYQVDNLLSPEEDVPTPDPLSDLQLTFKTVHETYLHLRALKCTEDVLQRFRDFMLACEKMLNPPPDPMMEQGPPMAGGEPMPPGVVPGGPPPPMDPMAMGAPMAAPVAPGVSDPAAAAFLGQ